MAIIDTLFMTFGAAHTYIAHIREYPPGVCEQAPIDSRYASFSCQAPRRIASLAGSSLAASESRSQGLFAGRRETLGTRLAASIRRSCKWLPVRNINIRAFITIYMICPGGIFGILIFFFINLLSVLCFDRIISRLVNASRAWIRPRIMCSSQQRKSKASQN